MPADNRLHALFQRWQQARQDGTPLSADELCHDCPELLSQLRRLIEAQQALDRALAETSDFEPSHVSPEPLPAAVANQNGAAKEAGPSVPGYEVLEELGRGGM